MNKIKFTSGGSSSFFNALDQEVQMRILQTPAMDEAKRLLWIKTAFYFGLHISAYLLLFFKGSDNVHGLAFNYIFIGMSGILLAFNVSHDACHGSYGKNKTLNYWLYHLSFNMQGTSAYLWQIRHNSSHHVFPNVDGCDVDIDNNALLRLSPQHPLKKFQRHQHIYAILVYSVYSLHWFLVKDVMYLFRKRVGNIVNRGYSFKQIVIFIFWKLAYIFVLLILPVLNGYTFEAVLLAFLIMHAVTSIFFIHVLIATHLCMETQFPEKNDKGELPMDYYTHQLVTSLDYAPSSKAVNFLLGGFNAHAAHHLYPRIPHTIYPAISVLIEQKAKEFNVPYNKLSWFESVRSHYRYLKMLGTKKVIEKNAACKNENCANARNCAVALSRTK